MPVAFILWVFALSRTSPTKTAVTITVNPVFASIVGAVAIGEGIGLNLIVALPQLRPASGLRQLDQRQPPPPFT